MPAGPHALPGRHRARAGGRRAFRVDGLPRVGGQLVCAGFAVRKHLGVAPVPGSVGTYFWGGLAGTTFFVDPALDLFGILMLQAPNQREYYRMLFRDMVYSALMD